MTVHLPARGECTNDTFDGGNGNGNDDGDSNGDGNNDGNGDRKTHQSAEVDNNGTMMGA